MKLTVMERDIAITLVEALVEYGLNEHLASWGDHATEKWFFNKELGALGFGASAGLSKVCIWHNDLLNWVIKVGFVEEVSMDYAAREYENYCMAEEEGLSQYFPTTVYLGTFGGRPFYLQEYAECEEARISSEWYDRLSEEYDDCEDIWNAIECMDDDERADLTFGDSDLTNFLCQHGIGDLHEGNFGYINGRLVIIDFSGWHH